MPGTIPSWQGVKCSYLTKTFVIRMIEEDGPVEAVCVSADLCHDQFDPGMAGQVFSRSR